MKIATFMGDKEKYFLTDRECAEAIPIWDAGKYYFCPRLQTRFPPHTGIIKPPDLQLEYDIFIEIDGDRIYDIARDKKTGKYYVLKETLEDGNDFYRDEKRIVKDKKYFAVKDGIPEAQEYISKLIPLDVYFDKHRAIQSAILLRK